MLYTVTGIFVLFAVGAAVSATTRVSQLKRMARALNLRYDKQLDAVVLPDSTAKAQFFKHGLHQFTHVLTWREPGYFIRVCEDQVFSSPLDKTPLLACTLTAAELTKNQFVPFVLAPRTTEPISSNLPIDLAARYTLSAPPGYTLPPQVTGFLKTVPKCYLEATPTALIYHEFSTAAVAQIQPLRFRAGQLLQALMQKPQPAEQPTPAAQPTATAPAALTETELQAQILLKLQTATHRSAPTASPVRYVYGLVMLVLLGGLLAAAWYILHYQAGF